jgi:HEAT repeat protein
MAESTMQKVRRLLQPTHDLDGWYAEFDALDSEAALPLLLEILANDLETEQTRAQAANLLGMLHDPRATNELINALHAPQGLLRARAAVALGQIGKPEERVAESLLQGLMDEDYFVRECSAKALGLMKRTEALPALELMSSTDTVSANRDVAKNAIETIRAD